MNSSQYLAWIEQSAAALSAAQDELTALDTAMATAITVSTSSAASTKPSKNCTAKKDKTSAASPKAPV